jgi:hypothetical protein
MDQTIERGTTSKVGNIEECPPLITTVSVGSGRRVQNRRLAMTNERS